MSITTVLIIINVLIIIILLSILKRFVKAIREIRSHLLFNKLSTHPLTPNLNSSCERDTIKKIQSEINFLLKIKKK